MEWNKFSLQIIRRYGMKFIQSTPFFIESALVLKQYGKLKVLDLCCGYGQHTLYLATVILCVKYLENLIIPLLK